MAKKDLSALKARLAKKAGKDSPAPPEPDAGADAAAATDDEPSAPSPAADIPAPGETARPADIPAPGETSVPEPQPAAAAPAATSNDPLAGGQAFDPNAGIIADTGATEVARKSNAGMLIGVAVVGIGLGAAGGWVLGGSLGAGQAVKSGRQGGQKNLAKVEHLSEVRGRIADSIGSTKTAIDKDPVEGSKELAALLTDNFQDLPQVDEVFGWQLAALHPNDIDATYRLYYEIGDVVVGLGLLAGFVLENAKVLKGGPTKFGVVYKNGTAVLVEVVDVLCDVENKTPCNGDDAGAQGYLIREALGGPEAVVPKYQPGAEGAPPTGASVLVPSPVYQYAIGEAPDKNAKAEYDRLAARLDEKLADMDTLEKEVLTALERFSKSPTVDAASVQPDAE